MSRILQPAILETKQELLTALKAGQIKTSKYNLLNDAEKTFVELMVFGDYTAAQAVRVMNPMTIHPGAIGNKYLSNPDVAATIEELSIQKDKKFMSELSTAQDMALNKLKYIMGTTKDDALAAACAKTILDKAEKRLVKTDKEEPVGRVQFNIQVENLYAAGVKPTEQVIIPIDDAEFEEMESNKKSTLVKIDQEIADRRKKLKEDRGSKLPINKKTGLAYTLSYEAVNVYEKEDDEV
jgi:hypothetical protein